ncbi:MAG: acetyl-CoA hydrolase/transferase C-terminal domain-containing protein [Desulfatibacillaceae bacterium]
MTEGRPAHYADVEQLVDDLIRKVGKTIIFGLPLGLGKPNHVVNAVYNRARQDPDMDLTVVTALSLEKPTWNSDLERRFLEPFVERVFGGFPDLEYVRDLRHGTVPDNIRLMEFYFKPGGFLGTKMAQQNYISSNYTHAARDILDRGVNVAGQIVCKQEIEGRMLYSMSCNPEVSFDVVNGMREREKLGQKVAVIGETNQNLPFMYGDAVVEPDNFDMLLEAPQYEYPLFGPPKMAVSPADYMIGAYVSSLVKDDGTLQIGIGSLGDALVYGLIMRHKNNDDYRAFLEQSRALHRFGSTMGRVGGTGVFEKGLTGSTEMLVDGYLHLYDAGVVKRKTYNHAGLQRLANDGRLPEKISPEFMDLLLEEGIIHTILTPGDVAFLVEFGIFKQGVAWENGGISFNGQSHGADLSDKTNRDSLLATCLGDRIGNHILIHGGFFLGPEAFYQRLRDMSEEERKQIFMTTVQNVNQLYGNQELKMLQRKNGRFANAGLMVMLSGAVVSDGLEDGQVVSGVGGQYNFVSMAHALPDGRSILMIRSVRQKGKEVKSNVVYNYGHTTIPRHLRDIVVTEYGIADLRGKCDWEVMAELINVADSRFQEELLSQAKAAGKMPEDYRIPDQFRNNTPERINADMAGFKRKGYFPPFPFGTDFTEMELALGKTLRSLKEKMSGARLPVPGFTTARKLFTVPEQAKPYLERLSLDKPQNAKETMLQRLVVYALAQEGYI